MSEMHSNLHINFPSLFPFFCSMMCASGNIVWPVGVHLTLKGGDDLCTVNNVNLPSLAPGQETTFIMDMKTPSIPGVYHCQWRVAMPGGALFGGE